MRTPRPDELLPPPRIERPGEPCLRRDSNGDPFAVRVATWESSGLSWTVGEGAEAVVLREPGAILWRVPQHELCEGEIRFEYVPAGPGVEILFHSWRGAGHPLEVSHSTLIRLGEAGSTYERLARTLETIEAPLRDLASRRIRWALGASELAPDLPFPMWDGRCEDDPVLFVADRLPGDPDLVPLFRQCQALLAGLDAARDFRHRPGDDAVEFGGALEEFDRARLELLDRLNVRRILWSGTVVPDQALWFHLQHPKTEASRAGSARFRAQLQLLSSVHTASTRESPEDHWKGAYCGMFDTFLDLWRALCSMRPGAPRLDFTGAPCWILREDEVEEQVRARMAPGVLSVDPEEDQLLRALGLDCPLALPPGALAQWALERTHGGSPG